MTIDHNEIARRLTNVPPGSDNAHRAMDVLTAAGIAFGDAIVAVVPPGREQSLAVTSVEQAVFWAKKGTALNQDQLPGIGPIPED